MIRVLNTSSEKLLEITVRIDAASGGKTCAICPESPSNFDTNSALCTKCYSDVYSHGWTLRQTQWGGRTLLFSPLSGQVKVQIPTEKPVITFSGVVTIGPRGPKMDICYFCNTHLGNIKGNGRNTRCLKCSESLEILGVSVLDNDHSTRKTVLKVPPGVELPKQEPLLEKTSWTAPVTPVGFTQRPLKDSDYDITAGQRKPDPTRPPAVIVNTERPPDKELTYSQKAMAEIERRFKGCEAITTAKAQSMLNSLRDKHFIPGDTLTMTFSFHLGSDSEIIIERANPTPPRGILKPDRVQYKEAMQQYGDGHCTAVESAKKFVHPRNYRGSVNVCQTMVDDPNGDDVGSDY